ncbi:MAG: glycosyltransferase family 9 protein [Candidatus Acidiferrum sp.]
MSEMRFAVVRLGSLGDIVHTFPAVAALRQSFPAARIIWLTHPRWVGLVASSNLATEIWSVDSRNLGSVCQVIAKLRAFDCDAVIDYQGLWKSALPGFLAGASRRIGFSSETIREYGVPILYTDRVKCRSVHIADQNGELSLRVGATNSVGDVMVTVPAGDESAVERQLQKEGITSYVVLSPGGGWRSKCWPAERFGALCLSIRDELGLRCVINYGPGEEDLLSSVVSASGNSQPLGWNGELGQLMALLKNARCVVGGDTGPLHLAVALRSPVVALFGPTDPSRNGPYSQNDLVLRSAGAVTTYRRGSVADPSLRDLSVEQVFAGLKKRLVSQP